MTKKETAPIESLASRRIVDRARFIAGPISEYSPGTRKIVDIGGRSVGIYNVDGTLYAVQNLCPHALAPICLSNVSGTFLPSDPGELVYGLEGRVLRCPWHGWEFDIQSGKTTFGIDHRHLATFPVEVEAGQVVVTMRRRTTSHHAIRDETV